jgi:hypothetical protein
VATASAQSAWQQQATWSATAGRLKRDITTSRVLVLYVVIGVAALETLAAQLTGFDGPVAVFARVLAATGAVLAAVGAVIQKRSDDRTKIAKWVRARSASEALKEQVYRYLTRSGRYARPDPEAALRAEVQIILDKMSDLESHAAKVSVKASLVPGKMELADYVAQRLEQQIDGYYRPRSEQLARSGERWHNAQIALLLSGSALGALVAFMPTVAIAGWVAVITTVAGAVGAEIEAARFDHLVVAYRATANRLEALRDEWNDTLKPNGVTQETRDDFVDRAEAAISVENQAWMAQWSKP